MPVRRKFSCSKNYLLVLTTVLLLYLPSGLGRTGVHKFIQVRTVAQRILYCMDYGVSVTTARNSQVATLRNKNQNSASKTYLRYHSIR